MSRALPIAAVIGLLGFVFLLQGTGVLPGSAMSGSTFWAVVGAVLIGAAAVVGWRSLRPARRG